MCTTSYVGYCVFVLQLYVCLFIAKVEKDPSCDYCEKPGPHIKTVNTSCVKKFKCALKLGLEAGLKTIEDYVREGFPDINGPKEVREGLFFFLCCFKKCKGVTKFIKNEPELDLELSDIYGVSYKNDFEEVYLLGEWTLQPYRVNDAPVWHKKDEYDRGLILYKYGHTPREKRWMVGTEVESDAGYVYSSSDTNNPILLGDTWLHYHGQSQAWLSLHAFRFSPRSTLRPQVQSIIPHHNAEKVSPIHIIEIKFTHPLEPGNGFIQFC
ncbi:hypothetical protein RFI_07531 [Reticulomyxa filosa]|uniref:Uncharacterized protein n=1 Tax=Reticulomyxa filosa TaxID=46433 RepID=X6NUJ0_RETFI|nr:hypothetical protein RFI_07531 [Reticulomyxa filosa]|eukprot:ETO29588.1 hypothetical protein RFI_07531 [Reticulomyxa filosa]